MTKRIWQADGVPTPKYVRLAFDQQSREQVMVVPDVLGLPLIVKPPREGSSIGVTKVEGYSQMQDAVTLSAKYDADVLCEEFIEGEEVTCPCSARGSTRARSRWCASLRPRAPTTTRTSTSPTT
jgi:D-alanine-D-alanine ligase